MILSQTLCVTNAAGDILHDVRRLDTVEVDKAKKRRYSLYKHTLTAQRLNSLTHALSTLL